MPPRAATPVGVVLLDKPAGPSSFALVAELRRRTGAKTGHTGTLDPFATGLLLLLSGAATRLAPCFSGLDKRYLTELDLTATTSTGDREGEVLERHQAPGEQELAARLERLRGEVELPIPAASAVKIGGQRAYRLARQGIEVEMPLRRSQVYALEQSSDPGAPPAGTVRLALHVSAGTYVRSIATALGGHCTVLRRTAVGPFSVEEADSSRLLALSEALPRLAEEARDRVPFALRAQLLAFEAGIAAGPLPTLLPSGGRAEPEDAEREQP